MDKTPTQTIIEDSIKGGWNKQYPVVETPEGVFHSKKDVRDILINWNGRDYPQIIRIHEALLDPKFWEAVGVTRGWSEVTEYCTSGCGCDPIDTCNINGDHPGAACERGYCDPEWLENQLKFIKALAQGLSIDEALKTLE